MWNQHAAYNLGQQQRETLLEYSKVNNLEITSEENEPTFVDIRRRKFVELTIAIVSACAAVRD